MRRKWILAASALLSLSSLAAGEAVTNPSRGDGFGSQFQTIIYSAIFAELNHKEFKYTPFKTVEHNYDNDPEFIKKKEWLINMIGNYPVNEDTALQKKIDAEGYIRFFESHLKECASSASLKKIKQFFRANKDKKKYFDDAHLHVAVHIRRPNPHDNRVPGTNTPDTVYLDAIRDLREQYRDKKPCFHIYSQGKLDEFKKIYSGQDYVFHINESVEDTFTSLVLADALITSPSSLSYTAGILSEGTVYYIPFWHPPLPGWIKLKTEKVKITTPQKKESFQQFISQHIPLRQDGKIAIPEGIKHIKLDIGLSYNAPHSQYWLSQENDLIVFGFEPNPDAVAEIRKGAVKRHPAHGEPLDPKHIGKRFFMVPCALGSSKESKAKFHITKDDCGCSSLYEPVAFKIEKVIDVPIFSLSDFFEVFPFDAHPIIDYIKIDTQGADLEIVKSAGNHLKDHVVFVTLEAENGQYKNTNNSHKEIDNYMSSMGFMKVMTNDTKDPTYINSQFIDYANTHKIKIFQM